MNKIDKSTNQVPGTGLGNENNMPSQGYVNLTVKQKIAFISRMQSVPYTFAFSEQKEEQEIRPTDPVRSAMRKNPGSHE